MRRSEQQPVIPENWLMPMRLVAVVVAYGMYRALESGNEVPGSLLVAGGALLVFYALISRYGLRRSDRSGMMQVGQTILGLGLVAVGALLLAG